MKELKNVLSLFDGHSGMQISLVDSGVSFENYYASEIDKHAIKTTQHNFPNTIQLGSVVDIDVSKLPKIDLISAGSPCQSFSFAGKRAGMSTTCNEEITTLEKYLRLKEEKFEFEGQSYLFWEFIRILTEVRKTNPDVLFLLENVEMGKKWESVLSHALGIFGVHINSALVSAQTRKRIYWTNIRTRKEGLFGDLYSDISQPEDRFIFLKDILQSDVDEKYYLSDKMVEGFKNQNYQEFKPKNIESKANCVTATSHKMEVTDNYIKIDKQGNPKANQEKASCFTAGGNSGGNHSDMDLFIVASRGRNPKNPKSLKSGLPTEQMLEPRKDGKTNCLTSVQKDNLLMQIEYIGNHNSQANRVYNVNGKSVCLQGEAGGGGAKTGLYLEEKNKTLVHQIIEKVKVRKNDVDLIGLKKLLRDSKKLTISEISKKLNQPKTKVEHWFRNDSSFAIPDSEVWVDLKKILGIVTNEFDNQILEFIEKDNVFEKSNRVYDKNGKSPTLMASGFGDKILIDYRIRRLTPTECKRLQTVPDWFDFSVVSDTQKYRQLGNGWSIEVIKHILSYGNFKQRD